MQQGVDFGHWPSPLRAEDLAHGARGFADLCVAGDDILWLESRPEEAGRCAVMRWRAGQVSELSPTGFSARSRVHEYGGGALAASANVVVASHAGDHRLYRISAGEATPLTPEAPTAHYGSLSLAPADRGLLAVRERHPPLGPVSNDLVWIDLASGAVRCLHQGRDFYASAALSPDGQQLAWLCWDHPHMPWDGAELWVAELGLRGELRDERQLAGGRGQAVADLLWQDDGTLLYAGECDGWWTPQAWDGRQIATAPPLSRERGQPLWIMGRRSLAATRDGRRYTLAWSEGLARIEDWQGRLVPTPALAHFESLAAHGEHLVALAGGPRQAHGLHRIAPDGRIELLRGAGAGLDPELASLPESIQFASDDGHEVHAFFYPPHCPGIAAPAGQLPPLLVVAHGGPTHAALAEFRAKTAFWTSRGFAVVDVNYRGSTGFGRTYRESLYGHWGVHDVTDCVAAAEFLVASGRVDPARVFIRGGSAGGLTVLLALCSSGLFAAGASYYGVVDPVALVSDTHKFESRYMDELMGPYPQCAEIYAERSPLRRLEQLATPLIVFQGLDDKVVPPAQSEALITALQRSGVRHEYHRYAGEGHGFRQAATLVHSLEAELAFYQQVMAEGAAQPSPDRG